MQAATTLTTPPPQAGQLLRVLGVAFAVAVGVGGVIGGGILRTPGVVVSSLPSLEIALALWVIVGIHAAISANVVCELLTALPRSGGMFIPARAAFGEPGGLLVGWTDWLGFIAAIGALSILSAEFLAIVVPGIGDHLVATGVIVLLAIIALNWIGVQTGSRAQIVGSAAKALFMIGIVVLILLSPPVEPRQAAAEAAVPLTMAGVIIAYQTIIGAYAGWNMPAYFAGENRDPGRDIPRGVYLTILLVVVVYTLVAFAVGISLPIDQLRTSTLPVADALSPVLGPLAVKVIAAIAVLIVVTCLNANVMGAPRILYGLACERLFPAIALRVNAGGTPYAALLLSGVAALGLAMTGEFATVFLIMAAFGSFTHLVVDLALFRLRRTMPDLPRPYRAMLYPWLPALALLLDGGILIAFISFDWTSGLFIVAAIAVCVPIGLWMRRNRSEPILIA